MHALWKFNLHRLHSTLGSFDLMPRAVLCVGAGAMGVVMDSVGVVSGWAAAVVAFGTVDGRQFMQLASSGGGGALHLEQDHEPGLLAA